MRHRCWLAALFLLLATPAAWALQFTSMEPGYGAPGDAITLNGIDFDSGAAYVVTVKVRCDEVVDLLEARFLHHQLDSLCIAAVESRIAGVHENRLTRLGDHQSRRTAFDVDPIDIDGVGTHRKWKRDGQGREQKREG